MKTAEIVLSPANLELAVKLQKQILNIEGTMLTVIDSTNGDQCNDMLSQALPLFSTTGEIMETATLLFDLAQGEAAATIIGNDLYLNAKYELQKSLLKGMTARWSALYERADKVTKDLARYIDGLRTVISYNKEHLRNIPQ